MVNQSPQKASSPGNDAEGSDRVSATSDSLNTELLRPKVQGFTHNCVAGGLEGIPPEQSGESITLRRDNPVELRSNAAFATVKTGVRNDAAMRNPDRKRLP